MASILVSIVCRLASSTSIEVDIMLCSLFAEKDIMGEKGEGKGADSSGEWVFFVVGRELRRSKLDTFIACSL